MLKDFGSDTLPIDATQTYDTSKSHSLSPSTWPHILATGTEILLESLQQPNPIGGWLKVNDDIAVLVLPATSIMRFHWANEMVVEGHYSSNRTVKP
jgi:hypothetical protein